MIQMPEQLDLPQRPLRIHVIIECVRDLLYRDHLLGLRIHHRAARKNTKTNHHTKTHLLIILSEFLNNNN